MIIRMTKVVFCFRRAWNNRFCTEYNSNWLLLSVCWANL